MVDGGGGGRDGVAMGAQDGEEGAYATACNSAAAVQQRRREEEDQSLEGPQPLHPQGLRPPPGGGQACLWGTGGRWTVTCPCLVHV